MLISFCFSTKGAEDCRTIIKERWEKLRRKPSNPERIAEFLHRMMVDQKIRTYYCRLYDSVRLLYRRIYDESDVTVIQADKYWSTSLIMFLRMKEELWNVVRKKLQLEDLGLLG